MLLIELSIVLTIIVILVCVIKYIPKLFYKLKNANLKLTKQADANGIILGRIGSYVLFSPIYCEGHAIVLGSSGSAKTTAVLLPTLASLSKNTGFFTIDISGDISENLASNANDSNLQTIIFDPTNTDNRVIYNPFDLIDKLHNEAQINEALTQLAFQIIPDKATEDNSKWFDDGGRSILIASLICFYHADFDFQEICKIINDNPYQELFDKIDKTENTQAIRYLNQFIGMSEKNISGCMQSAIAHIQLFNSPILDDKLRRPRHIDEQILTPDSIENSRIFFIIPDSKKEQYAPLIEIVVSQLIEYINNRPPALIKNKVVIAIDEFASFKNLDLSQPLAKSRKKGCRIIILCQNLNQIARNFGEYAMKEIVDNCSINVICNIAEPGSQKYFSEKAGMKIKRNEINQQQIPIFRPETFGKLRRTNIILCNGEHFRVFKNYFWKFYKNSENSD